jgi:hypothetical protein
MNATEEAIRTLAHRMWEDDGKPDGKDLHYWLRAAKELEVQNERPNAEGQDPDGPLSSAPEADRATPATGQPLADDRGTKASPRAGRGPS